MPKLRILIIAPTPYFADRGCHIRIWQEARLLNEAGYDVSIFTYHLGRNLPFEGVKIYRLGLLARIIPYHKTSAGPSGLKIYFDFLLFLKILWTTVARRQKFDIIHAHLHEGSFIGLMAKFFLHLPVIMDSQGSLVAELEAHNFLRNRLGHKFFSALEKWIINRADHIFVSSGALEKFIKNNFPSTTNKLSLLADAVYFEPNKISEDELNQLAASLRLNRQHPIVIYTGGLAKIKGVDYLLHAIPDVLRQHPQTQFLIVGYHQVERLQKIVDDLGVSGYVRFTGRVNFFDLLKYLALASVAVDPKTDQAQESSGKLLHYMASGLAIVAFDTTNSRAILADTGLFAQSRSTAELATKIIELLNNSPLSQELGQKARTRVQQYFSWQQRLPLLTTIYAQLTRT